MRTDQPTARRLPRVLALVAALVLTLAACGTVEETAEEVGEAATNLASEMESDPRPSPTDGATGGAGQPTPEDGGTNTESADGSRDGETSGGQSGNDRPAPVDDLAGLGANGTALLAASHPRLVIEVDVQQGLEADAAALDHLVSVIESVSSKDEIVRQGDNSFTSETSTWTSDTLRAVAEANRNTYSSDGTVSIYVLYVKGQHEDEDAIGLAYNASEFALFPERWQDAVGGVLGSSGNVERAVLVHEAGHLFGLVNLTYDSKFSRESSEHPGHSRNEGSVMHYAIETTAVGQVFDGPPPSDFDDRDRADLTFIRTGSY